MGDFEDARAHAVRAIDLLSTESGFGRAILAGARMNLGLIAYQEALTKQEITRHLAATTNLEINHDVSARLLREGLETAETAYRLALQEYADIEGSDIGVLSSKARVNLGQCLQAQGEAAEAMQLITEGCTAIERHFGPDHPDLVTCLIATAGAAAGVGRQEESIDAARRAVEVASRGLPALHPLVLQAGAVLQATCAAAGKPELAVEILRENGIDLASAIGLGGL